MKKKAVPSPNAVPACDRSTIRTLVCTFRFAFVSSMRCASINTVTQTEFVAASRPLRLLRLVRRQRGSARPRSTFSPMRRSGVFFLDARVAFAQKMNRQFSWTRSGNARNVRRCYEIRLAWCCAQTAELATRSGALQRTKTFDAHTSSSQS